MAAKADRTKARALYHAWQEHRRNLIQSLLDGASGAVALQPFEGSENVRERRGSLLQKRLPRIVVAVATRELESFQEKIRALRIERIAVKKAYGDTESILKQSRAMWLPVLVDNPSRVIMRESIAISTIRATRCDTLRVNAAGGDTDTLDVAAVCAERGWKRENVTIRRESGVKYEALIQRPGQADIRTRANCIIVCLDDPATIADVVLHSRRGSVPRRDTATPDFVWNDYTFVHYPDGLRVSR